MLRDYVERAAYNNLRSTFPDKAIQVYKLVRDGETPLMIAEWLGNSKFIQFLIIVLAANHMKRFNSKGAMK